MDKTDPEDIDVQREIGNALSQSLLYATGRDYLATPDQLQRLYSAASGKSPEMPPYFLQIESVGDHLDIGQNASASLQTALAACAGEQAHEVVFLVINDGRINRIYLGVRHPRGIADQFMESFKHFFRRVHPGSKLTELDPRLDSYREHVTSRMQRMRYGCCLTGIPSAKLGINGSVLSCLDGLLTGVDDKPFAYLVIAKPMEPADIGDVIGRCRDLIGQMHQFSRMNLTQGFTESYSRAIGETHGTQKSRTRSESNSDTKLGLGTILGGALGGAVMAFPPASLVAAIAYAVGGASLPFLSQSRSRSTTDSETFSESEARSLTETSGISRSRQGSFEIINAHVQAAEQHLLHYADRFAANRAIGLWSTEVYCLSESPHAPSLIGAQMQAVLNGAASSLEPVRWNELGSLLNDKGFLAGRRACERASVVFGAHGKTFQHPLGRQYEGFSTPLTTNELACLMNMPRREIPGLRVVPTASFSLNSPNAGTKAGIALGSLIDSGIESTLPYFLPFQSLAKHTLLAGINGSGKSTTCRTIIRSVMDAGIPFLVIEPAKDEYVEWAMALNSRLPVDDPRRIAVYMPGITTWRGQRLTDRLVLNPLEIVWTSSEEEPHVISHIDGLKAILAGSLPMQDILPVILEELLYSVYGQQWLDGVANRSTTPFPTLDSLYAGVSPLMKDKSYEPRFLMQLKEALHTRIASLSRHGWKRSLFNPTAGHVTDWGKLFDRPTVINLSQLKDIRDKAFTMALLLQFLYEYRIALAESGALSMNSGDLRHLTVVEEAHRVMAKPPASHTGEANPQAMAAQMFSDMLSEIRAYGEGFLIVEQVPERLIADAVKNTNLKIVHRIVSKDDRDAMGGSMNLTAPQAAMISRLRPGQAVICGDGDDSPCLVSVKEGSREK